MAELCCAVWIPGGRYMGTHILFSYIVMYGIFSYIMWYDYLLMIYYIICTEESSEPTPGCLACRLSVAIARDWSAWRTNRTGWRSLNRNEKGDCGDYIVCFWNWNWNYTDPRSSNGLVFMPEKSKPLSRSTCSRICVSRTLHITAPPFFILFQQLQSTTGSAFKFWSTHLERTE